jgi:hypothetical protein
VVKILIFLDLVKISSFLDGHELASNLVKAMLVEYAINIKNIEKYRRAAWGLAAVIVSTIICL